MAYSYQALAVLGSSKTGLAIGYRLVNADGTQAQAFTTSGVTETAVPGTYAVLISLGDAFQGTIEWGTSGTKYAEEEINPLLRAVQIGVSGLPAPDNTSIAAIKAKTDNLPADPASNTEVDTRLSSTAFAAAYVAPDNADILAIKAKTDLIPSSPAGVGSAMTLTSGERAAIAAELLDGADGVEAGLTLKNALRVIFAAAGAKLSGANTTTVRLRDFNDTLDRITATVDVKGNRLTVTYDFS